MNTRTGRSFLVKQIATIFILFSLLTASFVLSQDTVLSQNGQGIHPLDNEGYQVHFWLEQYYYAGETVYLSIQLTENGTVYPSGGVCPTIIDSEGTQLLGGVCFPVDENGYFNYSLELSGDAPLGTYHVEIEGHFGDFWEIIITIDTTFTVVSTYLDVDAHGPYEGFIGELLSFTGSVIGGKPPYTWLWDFGDGNTSDKQNPSHMYNESDLYPITLTVWDNQSSSGTDSTYVLIYAFDFGYYLYVLTDKTIYHPGDTIIISGRFTHNGIGVPCKSITIEIKDPSNQVIYSSTVTTNHTGHFTDVYSLHPQAPTGSYILKANTSVDSMHLTMSRSFNVVPHNVVANAYGPYTGMVDEPVLFQANATGGIPPYTYAWEFGDGTVGAGSNPYNTYTSAGLFHVNLTVTDAYNNSGTDVTTAIIVEDVDATRTVLVEYGTATTCGPCVTASQQLYDMYQSQSQDFLYVSLVTDKNNPAKQRFQELAPSPYPVPDVYFDGGFRRILGEQQTSQPYEQAIDDCKNRLVADLDMSVEVVWKENALLGINISIVNHDSAKYSGTLRIYIVEPTSRYIAQDGKPYHFGLLDYSENSVSVTTEQQINMVWDGQAKGYPDIIPSNIQVIAAVFNATTNFVDEVASGVPGDAFTILVTKPVKGLYLNNRKIRNYFLQRRPLIIGGLDVEVDAVEEGVDIIKVEFYLNNDLKHTDTSKPYSWTWDKKSILIRHTLKIIAYGADGKTSTVEFPVLKLF